jgi:hypothetical protein
MPARAELNRNIAGGIGIAVTVALLTESKSISAPVGTDVKPPMKEVREVTSMVDPAGPL